MVKWSWPNDHEPERRKKKREVKGRYNIWTGHRRPVSVYIDMLG